MPLIIVGAACFRQFKTGREGRKGLLQIPPDVKMKKSGKPRNDVAYPNADNEFDTVCYRTHWKAAETHFDFKGSQIDGWRNNPLRFLLFGRPQIGKTGAFLHLIYLLWDKITTNSPTSPKQRRVIQIIPEETEVDSEDEEVGSDGDDDSDAGGKEAGDAFASHPKAAYIQQQKFENRKQGDRKGKYGDPADDAVWNHYTKEPYKKEIHERARASSTASATDRKGAASSSAADLAASSDGGGGSAAAAAGGKRKRKQKQKVRGVSKPHDPTHIGSAATQTIKTFACPQSTSDITMQLSVPQCQACWWDLTGPLPKLAANEKPGETPIRFPIFIPSSGRAECALLDLSDAFPDKQMPYNEIVVVKEKDHAVYRKYWPNLTLLVLPVSANELGVGASRHCINLFAYASSLEDFPFCFILDDSVQYWKGLILPKDPNPFPRWKAPAGSDPSKVQHDSTFLQELLQHFQDPDFVENELCQFAAIGFGRVSRWSNIRYPYKRTHVYSAVISNLKLLAKNTPELNYNQHIHVWEDLDFNERVEAAGLMVCKCQRFAQVKKQMPSGGANYMIARSESDGAGAAAEGKAETPPIRTYLASIYPTTANAAKLLEEDSQRLNENFICSAKELLSEFVEVVRSKDNFTKHLETKYGISQLASKITMDMQNRFLDSEWNAQ